MPQQINVLVGYYKMQMEVNNHIMKRSLVDLVWLHPESRVVRDFMLIALLVEKHQSVVQN